MTKKNNMPPDLRSRGIKRYSEAANNVLKYVILGISKDIQKALNIYMYKWLKTAVLAICYDGVGNRLKGRNIQCLNRFRRLCCYFTQFCFPILCQRIHVRKLTVMTRLIRICRINVYLSIDFLSSLYSLYVMAAWIQQQMNPSPKVTKAPK